MITRLVIVGAGRAGAHAAIHARSCGFAGEILLVGDESHRPYDRPPLSKDVLLGSVDAEHLQLFPAEEYGRLDIQLRQDTKIIAIDRGRHVVQGADGTTLFYDKLIIATGARARRLRMEGQPPAATHYLRTLDDAVALRAELTAGKRIVIVGGGYIGLEVAATARQRGCETAVLEAGESVMGRVLPPEVAGIVASLHMRQGVDVRTGVNIASIDATATPQKIVLRDGRELVADCILVGIGAEPADELARAAGLDVQDGILVDVYGRTSDPDIYAVGDVARFHHPAYEQTIRLESWQHAERHAQAACKAILGSAIPYNDVPWFWSQQYGLNLQMIGLIAGYDDLLIRGDVSAEGFTAIWLRNGRVTGACAFNQPKDITPLRRIIANRAAPPRELLSDPAVDLRPLCRM